MSDLHISLVIPAWNEAELLPRLLATVEAARARYRGGAGAIEVIVADNDSTDATAAVARDHGCAVVSVTKRCIAAARNGGAAVARGDVIAFSDADFRLHPETFNTIAGILATPGWVGGGTGITMDRWSLGIRVAWSLIMPPLRWLGLEGGVWFCRRQDFLGLGGFDDGVRAGEDVRFLLRLKKLGRTRRPRERLAGGRTARRLGLPEAVVLNSTRKFDAHGDWHMVRLLAQLPLALFSRRRVDDFIQRYFYEGRPDCRG